MTQIPINACHCHLICLSHTFWICFHFDSTPLDWFEIRVALWLDCTITIKAKLLFFKKNWNYEWKYTLLDAQLYTPNPFERVGEMSPTRTLLLKKSGLICESKDGSVGKEGIILTATYMHKNGIFLFLTSILFFFSYPELQCWEAGVSLPDPKIMTFVNVTKVSGEGLNRRRLELADHTTERIFGRHRGLIDTTFELKCILSEVNVRS